MGWIALCQGLLHARAARLGVALALRPAGRRGAAELAPTAAEVEPAAAQLLRGWVATPLVTMGGCAGLRAAARPPDPAALVGPAPRMVARPAADLARNEVRAEPVPRVGRPGPQELPPTTRGRPPARSAGAGPLPETALAPGAPLRVDRMCAEQVHEPDNRPEVDARAPTSDPRIVPRPVPGVATISPRPGALDRRAETIGAATPPGPTLVAGGRSEVIRRGSVAVALDPMTPIWGYQMSRGSRRYPRTPTSRCSTVRYGLSCAH